MFATSDAMELAGPGVESLTRAAHLSLRTAYVGSGQPFYTRFGFPALPPLTVVARR